MERKGTYKYSQEELDRNKIIKMHSQTDPHRKTDFVKLADGFGLKGYRCKNLPEFQAAFADALKQKGPTWIECVIDKDERVLPMIPGGGDINDIIME